MRVTKSKLKKIIQEELQKILNEHPMPQSHRHRIDPLEATLWPIGGDPVYPALENLPASMYGPGGTGPEGQLPYGHYGTDPEQEWPRQWADPVPLIPGLTPEETAAYYGIDPRTGDPISHTPNVGREGPDFIPESLQKIIQEELQKLLYEEEVPTRLQSPYGDTSWGKDIGQLAGQSTELTPTPRKDIRKGLADVKASPEYTDQPVSRAAWEDFRQGVDRFRSGETFDFPKRPTGRVEGAPGHFSSYEDQPSGEGANPDMPRHKTEFQIASPELAAHYKARKATPEYKAAVAADAKRRRQ